MKARVHEEFIAPMFTVWQTGVRTRKKARLHFLRIKDRYDRPRHRVSRRVFGGATNLLERHYQRRDNTKSKNHVQKMIFLTPAMRGWRQHMPGGFATYPVHNPEVKRLSSGEKMDFITRRLFRHSFDGRGLRTRSYAMTWWVYEHAPKRAKGERLRWLSLASGTGQPTFDAGAIFTEQPEYFLSDLSDEALSFSRELAAKRGLDMSRIHFMGCDVTNETALKQLLKTAEPDVIDMMGLVEYLDDETVIALIKTLKKHAKKSLICFTNMRPEHPELMTHKHGLEWPGVKVRSIDDMLALIQKSRLSLQTVDVLLPSDKVYAVYCLA